jgi:hypothetical protein
MSEAQSKIESIVVNGVGYVSVDSIKKEIVGNRHVVVVDRGWIFAGDIKRENGRIKLSRALHVFKWESIGFAKVIEQGKSQRVDLRPIADVDIPDDAEIFSIPVDESWGL